MKNEPGWLDRLEEGYSVITYTPLRGYDFVTVIRKTDSQVHLSDGVKVRRSDGRLLGSVHPNKAIYQYTTENRAILKAWRARDYLRKKDWAAVPDSTVVKVAELLLMEK
jgi:hypothetical protein